MKRIFWICPAIIPWVPQDLKNTTLTLGNTNSSFFEHSVQTWDFRSQKKKCNSINPYNTNFLGHKKTYYNNHIHRVQNYSDSRPSNWGAGLDVPFPDLCWLTECICTPWETAKNLWGRCSKLIFNMILSHTFKGNQEEAIGNAIAQVLLILLLSSWIIIQWFTSYGVSRTWLLRSFLLYWQVFVHLQ